MGCTSVTFAGQQNMNTSSKFRFLAVAVLGAGLCSCSMIGPLVNMALPFAGVKLAMACIPENTAIDTPSGGRPIELLQAGDSVIGFSGKPVRILQKHSYLENPETIFLHITFSEGATVDLCGMHRIGGVRAQNIRVGQSVAGRKVASIETRKGETRSYDLLTEDKGYQINGIPVNSMIEEMHAAAASGMRSVKD